MKFSVFTVSMPEYDIEQTVKVLKELGYDGVEWRVSSPAPAQKPENYTFEERYWCYNQSTLDINKIEDLAPQVKSVCDKYSIEICSLTTYLKPCDLSDIERVIKAAVTMGCNNIRVYPPNYDESENYVELFNKTINQVKELEKLAVKYSIRINFETHMGNIIPSASAAYRFAANFNPNYIGIIYDPGNLVYEGFENYKLGLELLGDYLAHVHVKNSIWVLSETSDDGVKKWKPTWAPLKEGFADLSKLLKLLKAMGYDRYVSIEDFSNAEDTYTKLKNNLKFINSILT